MKAGGGASERIDALIEAWTTGEERSGASKHENVRYLDIHEDEEIDDKLLTSWIRQAAEQPGEPLF